MVEGDQVVPTETVVNPPAVPVTPPVDTPPAVVVAPTSETQVVATQPAEVKVPKKEGRPTVMTDEVVRKLESIFKIGGTVEEAVTYAGIGRRTYFDHLSANEDFRTKIEAAQHYSDIAAKHNVIEAIVKTKDLSTSKWWLEKRQFNQPLIELNQQFNEFTVVGEDGQSIQVK